MKIEIWSDVMCPFCYIGKRRFETALSQFPNREAVEVVWKSFQLNPELPQTSNGKSVYQYLSETKGISLERAREMNEYVTGMAAEEGLGFQMDKATVSNTFDAHRLIHLAETKGLQHEAEERLFKAYFEEGADMGDHATLERLGLEIGLSADEVQATLASDRFAYEVKTDVLEARNLGIGGVPFFVIDRKYGVSGAQPTGLFLQTLEKAWQEANPVLQPVTGYPNAACTDESCAV